MGFHRLKSGRGGEKNERIIIRRTLTITIGAYAPSMHGPQFIQYWKFQ